MSLFNRAKMRAVFAAVIAAALPRPAPISLLRPVLAPTPIPRSRDTGFDPYALFKSFGGPFGLPQYRTSPSAEAIIERLLAWKRQRPRAYRWAGARVHPRKRRAHAWGAT